MKYRLAVSICLVVMVAWTAIAQTKAAPAQGQPKPPAATPVEEPRPALGVPDGYEYLARGRRDPFVNPAPKPAPGTAAAEAPREAPRPAGLKGATVDEVTVSGVFVSKTEPSMARAILLVPGLRAPVIASRGDELFDAVIKEIRQDSVVFTKRASEDKPGTTPSGSEQIKKLRSAAGDKK